MSHSHDGAGRPLRDILGLWAGDGGEGAKYWLHVLIEIKNRGVADVCIVVCDGLAGLPDAISSRSVKPRGRFPNEQAALKHLYLTIVRQSRLVHHQERHPAERPQPVPADRSIPSSSRPPERWWRICPS